MTVLYYHFFDGRLPTTVFNDKLKLLSGEQAKKIRSFHRWQDAQASLVGKLLLQTGFRDLGISATLQQLQYTEFGKPYLKQYPICFNISHAGNCVVCILSTDIKCIGIDVEAILPIDVCEFKNIWAAHEWEDIQHNGLETFYHYWTCKEALIKADGQGLNIPLNQVEIRKQLGIIKNTVYYLKPVSLQRGYVINMATSEQTDDVITIALQPADIYH